MHQKKTIILNILTILHRYSDENHRLSQKDISDYLKKDFDMSVDRKAVRRNLTNLLDLGYPIEYTETTRFSKNKKTGEKEETTVLSDFYIEREFTNGELRLLIDSVLFAKNIPSIYAEDLIKKLSNMGNEFFKKEVRPAANVTAAFHSPTAEIFMTIEILGKAISEKKKVSFIYNEYGIDKKLHPRTLTPKIVSPYKLVISNNNYYLVGNSDEYSSLSNFRIDKITNIEILPKKIKPIEETDTENKELINYAPLHTYMFSGKPEMIKITIPKRNIGNVIDYFGNNFTILEENEDEIITVEFSSNIDDAYFWILQHSEHVRVLAPQELRDRMRHISSKLSFYYGQDDDNNTI